MTKQRKVKESVYALIDAIPAHYRNIDRISIRFEREVGNPYCVVEALGKLQSVKLTNYFKPLLRGNKWVDDVAKFNEQHAVLMKLVAKKNVTIQDFENELPKPKFEI